MRPSRRACLRAMTRIPHFDTTQVNSTHHIARPARTVPRLPYCSSASLCAVLLAFPLNRLRMTAGDKCRSSRTKSLKRRASVGHTGKLLQVVRSRHGGGLVRPCISAEGTITVSQGSRAPVRRAELVWPCIDVAAEVEPKMWGKANHWDGTRRNGSGWRKRSLATIRQHPCEKKAA